MASFDKDNPVVVGDATKADHADVIFDNTLNLQQRLTGAGSNFDDNSTSGHDHTGSPNGVLIPEGGIAADARDMLLGTLIASSYLSIPDSGSDPEIDTVVLENTRDWTNKIAEITIALDFDTSINTVEFGDVHNFGASGNITYAFATGLFTATNFTGEKGQTVLTFKVQPVANKHTFFTIVYSGGTYTASIYSNGSDELEMEFRRAGTANNNGSGTFYLNYRIRALKVTAELT